MMNMKMDILFMPCIIRRLKLGLFSPENMVRTSRYDRIFPKIDFIVIFADMKIANFIFIIDLTLRIP